MLDNIVAHALLEKILNNEPLSPHDAERWTRLITIPIQIANPTVDTVEKLKFNLRQSLKAAHFDNNG